MAHLVVKPQKLSVRQYYGQIIKHYYQITVTPKYSRYMIAFSGNPFLNSLLILCQTFLGY